MGNYLAGGVFLGKIENFPQKKHLEMWEESEKIIFFALLPHPPKQLRL
jgi:hypothetical protein